MGTRWRPGRNRQLEVAAERHRVGPARPARTSSRSRTSRASRMPRPRPRGPEWTPRARTPGRRRVPSASGGRRGARAPRRGRGGRASGRRSSSETCPPGARPNSSRARKAGKLVKGLVPGDRDALDRDAGRVDAHAAAALRIDRTSVTATRSYQLIASFAPVTDVDLFDYFLPADRIAQEARPRGTSPASRARPEHGRRRRTGGSPISRSLLCARRRARPQRRRASATRGSTGRDEEGRLVEIFLSVPSIRSGAAGRRSRSRAAARSEAGPSRLPGGATARIGRVHPGRARARSSSTGRSTTRYLEKHRRTCRCRLTSAASRALPTAPRTATAYQTVFAREPLAVAAPDGGAAFHARNRSKRSARAAPASPT